MSDIDLVIKINEEIYKHIGSMQFYIPGLRSGKSLLEEILKAIRMGTPLPKEHGRLIDADVVDDNIYDLTRSMDLNYGQISEVVDNAPTIIEADTESEEEE